MNDWILVKEYSSAQEFLSIKKSELKQTLFDVKKRGSQNHLIQQEKIHDLFKILVDSGKQYFSIKYLDKQIIWDRDKFSISDYIDRLSDKLKWNQKILAFQFLKN